MKSLISKNEKVVIQNAKFSFNSCQESIPKLCEAKTQKELYILHKNKLSDDNQPLFQISRFSINDIIDNEITMGNVEGYKGEE